MQRCTAKASQGVIVSVLQGRRSIGDTMPDVINVFAEARRLIGSAQMEVEASQQLIADFLNTECELTATLAQIALDSFAAGHLDRARGTAAAAKEGHDTVLRFRLKLKDDTAREEIEAILVTLDPLIGKLAAIK